MNKIATIFLILFQMNANQIKIDLDQKSYSLVLHFDDTPIPQEEVEDQIEQIEVNPLLHNFFVIEKDLIYYVPFDQFLEDLQADPSPELSEEDETALVLFEKTITDDYKVTQFRVEVVESNDVIFDIACMSAQIVGSKALFSVTFHRVDEEDPTNKVIFNNNRKDDKSVLEVDITENFVNLQLPDIEDQTIQVLPNQIYSKCYVTYDSDVLVHFDAQQKKFIAQFENTGQQLERRILV